MVNDVVVGPNQVLRSKNGHYVTLEGPKTPYPIDHNLCRFRAPPTENVSLARVQKVDTKRGICSYSLSGTKELSIPWNHLGDRLVQLWKLVLADKKAGRRPRQIFLENVQPANSLSPFSGCRLRK